MGFVRLGREAYFVLSRDVRFGVVEGTVGVGLAKYGMIMY